MNRSIDSFLSNRSYFDKEDNVVTRNSSSTRDFTEAYSLGRNIYDYAEYIQEADGDEDIDKLSSELDSAMNEINNAKDESSNEPETEDTPDVEDTSNTEETPTEPEVPEENNIPETGGIEVSVTTSTSEEPEVPNGNVEELSDFGMHGGDDLPNNQYDPEETSRLMGFVADEGKALSDYVEAAKVSKIDFLQRLYSDIADEERFHLEQLLFAHSEITGTKYEPHDPDIRKEYEELLALGMDEGSAMATAVDKFNLRPKTNDDGDIDKDLKDLNEQTAQLEQAVLYLDTVRLVYESGDEALIEKVQNLYVTEGFIQEDVSVTNNYVYSKKMSPLRLIIGLFVAAGKLARKIYQAIRKFIEGGNHRFVKTIEFVKKHGIAELFKATNVALYLWNDKTSSMDIDPILYYANNCFWLTKACARMCGLNKAQYGNMIMSKDRLFVNVNQRFRQIPPEVTCYRNITSLDIIKSKVVVNQNNADRLANYFFAKGQYDDEIDKAYANGINFNVIPVSGFPINGLGNFFTIINMSTMILDSFSQVAQNFAGEVEGLQNTDHSVYYTKPKVYNNCIDYLAASAKATQKIINILVSDINSITTLESVIKNT
jgi:rubrerythrin